MTAQATSLKDVSLTAGSNGPAGTDSVTAMDDGLRTVQAVVRQLASIAGSATASAATCDIGAVDEAIQNISGTTTITSFGTVSAGIWKWVVFQGALTLTHNGTSLILPGAANITTAAGDVALMLSLGSGNWRCLYYSPASGNPVTFTPTLPLGSAAAPSLNFSGDSNTGLYSPGADQVALVAGGTARVTATTSGATTTGTHTATAFSGPLTGNVNGNLTGNVSSCATIANASGGITFSHNSANTVVFQGSNTTSDLLPIQIAGSVNAGFKLIASGHTLNSTYGDCAAFGYSGEVSGAALLVGANGIVVRKASMGAGASTLTVDTNTGGASTFDLIVARTSVSGTADTEFRVRGDGTVYSDGGTSMTTPADYAEMFEWADGNPDGEDRVGYSVALVGERIRIAVDGDVPIGVVSGNPAVLADSGGTRWSDKYMRDEFNRPLFGPDGLRLLNPSYDAEREYVPRAERKEWAPVGLVGKLRVRRGCPVAPNWSLMRSISADVDEYLVK